MSLAPYMGMLSPWLPTLDELQLSLTSDSRQALQEGHCVLVGEQHPGATLACAHLPAFSSAPSCLPSRCWRFLIPPLPGSNGHPRNVGNPHAEHA